jgi:predicted DCC family thiol-disulfide oxidoreductase YuxK
MQSAAVIPMLQIYYDGLCPLCSREIDYYRTKSGAEKILWNDITAPNFDAQSEGLDPDEVHRSFHAKLPDGRVLRGVEAFVEIWKIIPSLSGLLKMSQIPGARPIMKIGYFIFARGIRPYLPRNSRPGESCDGPECELPSKRSNPKK